MVLSFTRVKEFATRGRGDTKRWLITFKAKINLLTVVISGRLLFSRPRASPRVALSEREVRMSTCQHQPITNLSVREYWTPTYVPWKRVCSSEG